MHILQEQMNVQKTGKPNIPVFDLSFCGDSTISLLSTSALTSMELSPINIQQAMYCCTYCSHCEL